MSVIEGIGDDLLSVFGFLIFLLLISLAWLSTHVYRPSTFFHIEQQINNQIHSEQHSSSLLSANDTLTEYESDISTNEIEEYPLESIIQSPTSMNNDDDEQLLRITIKFLNETQKLICVNINDKISKVKRLYFADELTNNQIIRFIYQGRELEDSQTIRQYNIRDQTVIHCQITSQRRHSTPIRLTNPISSSHPDTSSFLDLSPINISFHIFIISIVFLVSLWYLRFHYRVLFTPISTIILIVITVLILIFTCGSFFSTSRQYSIS